MTAFYLFIYFHRRLLVCLRRSGFVVGGRENGLGARPNFLYAGKTLHTHTSVSDVMLKTTSLHSVGFLSHIHTQTHTYTHTHTHEYMHLHTHTHTHARMHIFCF